MATIQEQLESAVAIYNKCAGKVNKFINGSADETIESDSGNKPTIAKIVKDTQDSINLVTTGINEKALEVLNNKNTVENLKADIDLIHRQSEIPLGAIMAFPKFNLPQGFLECDGSVIQANTYPQLVTYLTEDENATQAILPDLRGEFIRGWDNTRGIDNNRILASGQIDTMQKLTGSFRGRDNDSPQYKIRIESAEGAFFSSYYSGGSSASFGSASTKGDNQVNFDSSRVVRTDFNNETRPRNVAMVYAIKAFGTLVNMGDLDLNSLTQEVQNLKTSKIITNDTNLFTNYCEYGWFGKISSNGGGLLESINPLKAYGTWGLGNPVFNKEDRTWNLASGFDRIGVAYKKGTIPSDTYVKMEWTMRFKCTSFGTSNTSIMSMSYPNQDYENALLRLEKSTGKLKLWAAENDTAWSLASGSLFNKVYELNKAYDLKVSYDVSLGKFKVEWSDDLLEYSDENKVWNLDRELTFGIAKRLFLRQPNGTTIVGFGTDSHEYDEKANISPQIIYADYCSFKLDGIEYAKENIASGFCFKQSEEYHQIVGYKDNKLISEFCHNSNGSDTVNINGDRALVFSGFTYNNGLTYDAINYTDIGSRRLYSTYPWHKIIGTNSTEWRKLKLTHFAPKNATELNLYGDVRGGVIYVENYVDNDPTKTRIAELDAWLEQSNQYDRHAQNVPLPYRDGFVVVGVDSYDSNNIYLHNQGFSLVRGVRQ